MSNNCTFKTELLGDIATIRRGITYSAHMLVERSDGIPYVNMKSFKKGGGFNKNGIKYFSGAYLSDDLLKDNDLLIVNTDVTLDGDIIGLPAYLPDGIRKGKALFSHHVTRLRLSADVIPEYLSYLLCIEEYRRWMLKYARGTTVLMLDMTAIKKIPVKLHSSLASQKVVLEKIRILDAVIEKTEALIEKYQQVKAGLMHDLFTRGITADGKLRPSREQAPELYQETETGWIPEEWENRRLGDTCTWYSGGTPSRGKASWWMGDIPWLSPKDMKSFDLSDTEEHVTEIAAFSGSRIMPANTVFIVVRGMILAHSFPVVCSGEKFCFNQDIKSVVGLGDIGNRFLAYWFDAHKNVFLKKTTEATHGTKRFDMKDLYDLRIGVPTLTEQKSLVGRLDTLGRMLVSEKENLEKLLKQKSGLMHDLLTGKVPVPLAKATPHV